MIKNYKNNAQLKAPYITRINTKILLFKLDEDLANQGASPVEQLGSKDNIPPHKNSSIISQIHKKPSSKNKIFHGKTSSKPFENEEASKQD